MSSQRAGICLVWGKGACSAQLIVFGSYLINMVEWRNSPCGLDSHHGFPVLPTYPPPPPFLPTFPLSSHLLGDSLFCWWLQSRTWYPEGLNIDSRWPSVALEITDPEMGVCSLPSCPHGSAPAARIFFLIPWVSLVLGCPVPPESQAEARQEGSG